MPIKRVPGKDRKFIEATIKALDGHSAKVGWFKSARYPTGVPVAAIAAQNEFGDTERNIPPRPFMRPTITKQKNKWFQFFNIMMKRSLVGKFNPNNIYETIGLKMAGDIRTAITRVISPPLSPLTIYARILKTTRWARLSARYENAKERGHPDEIADIAEKKSILANQFWSSPKFTKPLIDTKIMLNTLSNEVTNDTRK